MKKIIILSILSFILSLSYGANENVAQIMHFNSIIHIDKINNPELISRNEITKKGKIIITSKKITFQIEGEQITYKIRRTKTSKDGSQIMLAKDEHGSQVNIATTITAKSKFIILSVPGTNKAKFFRISTGFIEGFAYLR